MPNTAIQLREYLDATAAPVELDDVLLQTIGTDAVRPLQTRRSRRPRRDWLYAPAAAVVVLVLVGAAALLFRVTGSGSPVATTPPIESLSSLTWSRVHYDEAVFGGWAGIRMRSVVSVGSRGLVAVGGDAGNAVVWTSPDGITWSRVPYDEALFSGAIMSSVTAGGPGLVAVGEAGSHAAVWTSVDGISWSRVRYDEAVFGEKAEAIAAAIPGGSDMRSVTIGGPGLVAVGSDGSPKRGGVAAVWTSPDGINWSRVPHNEAVFGGEDDGYYGQSMSSVTAGGPGLVAVGSDVGRAAVWTSPDGITWSRVPNDEAVFGGAGMSSVTAGGPGLVAVGGNLVWTSVDGITWSRIPHDKTVFGGPTEMRSVVSVGAPGLVAVGSDAGRAAVWTSPDGITWSRVPHDEAVFGGRLDMEMWSVTAGGAGLVAVGADGPDPRAGLGKFDAPVWVALPAE